MWLTVFPVWERMEFYRLNCGGIHMGKRSAGSFWGVDTWIPQKLFLLEFNIRDCRFNNSNKLVLRHEDLLLSELVQ